MHCAFLCCTMIARVSLIARALICPWLALVVLEYRLWKMLAQRRVVEVSAGGETLAPIDERQAQDLLRLVVVGVGVQSVGFEGRDARTIRPRDRFQCACARPQLSPTRLHGQTHARGGVWCRCI